MRRSEGIPIWKFLTADVERVESIRSVSTVLQQVFFGLSELFPTLVLLESVAAANHSSRLDGENQVIIVLAVKHRHQPLFTGKALVDEQVLLIM